MNKLLIAILFMSFLSYAKPPYLQDVMIVNKDNISVTDLFVGDEIVLMIAAEDEDMDIVGVNLFEYSSKYDLFSTKYYMDLDEQKYEKILYLLTTHALYSGERTIVVQLIDSKGEVSREIEYDFTVDEYPEYMQEI